MPFWIGKKFVESKFLNKYSSYTKEIFCHFYLSVVSARSYFLYFSNFRIFFYYINKTIEIYQNWDFFTPLETLIEVCDGPVNHIIFLNACIQINFQSF